MPFTKQIDRDKVEKYRRGEIIDTSDWAVGDWCYFYYRPMIDAWKNEPRWTTAHNIHLNMKSHITGMENYCNDIEKQIEEDWQLKEIYESKWHLEKDKITAYELAWQVFFARHVLPYEDLKCRENGDIT